MEVHSTGAVVTRHWKYIANHAPAPAAERMKADAEAAGTAHRARQVGWSGGTMHFNALTDFPAYFAPDQLYDLDNDLYERRNLTDEKQHTETLKMMRRTLSEALAPLPHSFREFKTRSS